MITQSGNILLSRWIYVMVSVEKSYLLPYSEANRDRIASCGEYGEDFSPLLERFIQSAISASWPAGSYYPGGWYRELISREEDTATVPIEIQSLERYRLPEVVIEESGNWFVGSRSITGKVLGYFLRNLEFDPEFERYRISHRLDRYSETRYIHHHSPPIRVTRVICNRQGAVLILNTGEQEALCLDTLRLDSRERLYCAVTPERLPAVFEEPARWEVLKEAEEKDGCWRVRVGDQVHDIPLDSPWIYSDSIPD